MIKKLFNQAKHQREQQRKAELYRNLIRHEAKIGGELFGALAHGRRREFFCLDEHTWVWHEEWIENGEQKVRTTRYDVRPSGILKSQNGEYKPVAADEVQKLYEAARLYQNRVRTNLYQAV